MPSRNKPDENYQQWLAELKNKIRNSQLQAALKVNVEMLLLYWEMGKDLAEKQSRSAWGDKMISQLSKDLMQEFPDIKGFSRSNLFNIIKWYRFYAVAPYLSNKLLDYQLKITKGKNSSNNLLDKCPNYLARCRGGITFKS